VMEISIAALRGTDIHRITVCPPPQCAEDFAPAWSPDGSLIAFSTPSSQGDFHDLLFSPSVIEVVERDGGRHATVVSPPGGSAVEPAWVGNSDSGKSPLEEAGA
jgi:hypothetical protein